MLGCTVNAKTVLGDTSLFSNMTSNGSTIVTVGSANNARVFVISVLAYLSSKQNKNGCIRE